jgi:hypothetical protein
MPTPCAHRGRLHSRLCAQTQAPGQAPVANVNVCGKYAFVEFRTPEYATAAVQLDGQVVLMGNNITIRRPAGAPRITHTHTTGGGVRSTRRALPLQPAVTALCASLPQLAPPQPPPCPQPTWTPARWRQQRRQWRRSSRCSRRACWLPFPACRQCSRVQALPQGSPGRSLCRGSPGRRCFPASRQPQRRLRPLRLPQRATGWRRSRDIRCCRRVSSRSAAW